MAMCGRKVCSLRQWAFVPQHFHSHIQGWQRVCPKAVSGRLCSRWLFCPKRQEWQKDLYLGCKDTHFWFIPKFILRNMYGIPQFFLSILYGIPYFYSGRHALLALYIAVAMLFFYKHELSWYTVPRKLPTFCDTTDRYRHPHWMFQCFIVVFLYDTSKVRDFWRRLCSLSTASVDFSAPLSKDIHRMPFFTLSIVWLRILAISGRRGIGGWLWRQCGLRPWRG